jgi:TRAP-type mannitol/chloroaromatic compound transport system permease small subunit
MSDSFANLPSWVIIVIVVLALFDAVMKVIAMWKSARNNHLAWFIFLAIFNTVGILPIVYLVLHRGKEIPKAE